MKLNSKRHTVTIYRHRFGSYMIRVLACRLFLMDGTGALSNKVTSLKTTIWIPIITLSFNEGFSMKGFLLLYKMLGTFLELYLRVYYASQYGYIHVIIGYIWSICPYISWLIIWYRDNHVIAPVPVTLSWRTWINRHILHFWRLFMKYCKTLIFLYKINNRVNIVQSIWNHWVENNFRDYHWYLDTIKTLFQPIPPWFDKESQEFVRRNINKILLKRNVSRCWYSPMNLKFRGIPASFTLFFSYWESINYRCG